MHKKITWAAVGLVAACAAIASVTLRPSLDAPFESEAEREAEGPPDGDYWVTRASYPTGRFDPTWLVAAARQERAMLARSPAGVRRYAGRGASPLSLDPNRFISLGPMPENNSQGGYGHVSGRTNVIKVDPAQTVQGATVVYAGSDGGGVWKTTNCCTANTTWRVVTDFPEIASMSISDLTIDPNDHNVVYATTGDLNFGSFSFGASGVLKSTDQGEHWQLHGTDVFTPFYPGSANGFPQYQAVGKVVVDPNDSSKVVVGTKTGLYFSYDAGVNWTGPCFTNSFATGPSAQRQDVTGLLAVNAGSGVTRLYAAIGTRGTPTPVQPDLGLNGANGVYRTAMPASGCPVVANWTLLDNNWPAGIGNGVAGGTTIGRIELAVAPSDPNRIYAEAADTGTRKVNSFYRSNDGGITWTKTLTNGINADASDIGCEGNSSGGGAQMWYDAGLTVDPNNPDKVWMSTIDATLSSDGGQNFYDVTCGYGSFGNAGQPIHVDHHARAFVGNDSTRLLLGSDGGVYFTANADAPVTSSTANNSMSFIHLNDTIDNIEFYFGDITSNFANAASPATGAGAQDNGCSRAVFSGSPTGPVLWNSNCSGDGTTTKIEPVFNNVWFNSSQNGSLARSTTGGASGFSSAAANTGGTWGGDVTIFAMSYDLYKWGNVSTPGSGCDSTNGCNHMIAGTSRLWETTQATVASATTLRSSWKARTPNLTKNNLIIGSDNRSYINYVAYSFTDPTVAMVGTNDGNVQVVFGLGGTVAGNCPTSPPLSANCANAVNVTDNNAVLPNRPIQGVRFDPTSALIAYAAVGGFNENTPGHPGHVFRLTCTANCASFTWADKTGNLPNIPAQQVMPNPLLPQQVFVGTDWGLYYTDDITQASPTWYRFEGLPHVMVWELVVDRGFTTLAAFTRSRGAWAWPLPSGALTPGADLAVTQTGPSQVLAGNDATYTITVTNNGPATATNVVASDTTPAGLSFVSNAGACATAFPCALGSIASGASKTITTTFHVPAGYSGPTPFVNLVSVTSDLSDSNAGNNSASTNTTIAHAADLGVDLMGPFEAVRGTNVEYTIVVTNHGPEAAASVTVTNPTPSGLTFVSNAGACATPFPCTLTNLAVDETRTITATFAVPAAYAGPAPIADTATVGGGAAIVDGASANDTITLTSGVRSSNDVAVSVTAPAGVVPGADVVYTITLTNAGPSQATSLSLAAATPTGLTFTSNGGDCAGAFPCGFATLDPGVTRTIVARFTVPANYAGPATIVFDVGTGAVATDPVAANNSASANTSVLADGLFKDSFE